MLSRKAKHLALAANNSTSSWARFFATLRYAQNDRLLYVFANKGITIIPAIILVGLSYKISGLYFKRLQAIAELVFPQIKNICRGPLFREGKLFAKTPFAAILSQLCPVARDQSNEP
jgi:hypothetical protein